MRRLLLLAVFGFHAPLALAQSPDRPPAPQERPAAQPKAPTGQTVPDPSRTPPPEGDRRDTGSASGAAGPNIPNTGTPRIMREEPPVRR